MGVLLGAAGVTIGPRGLAGQEKRSIRAHRRALMGTRFQVFIDEGDAELAGRAADAAFERAAAIEAACSDYLVGGELNGLCRMPHGEARQVSPELFGVLATAKRLAEATGGLVDPTIGPLSRLWRESRDSRRLPAAAALEKALAATGHRKLVLDPQTRAVTLRRPGMQLDLGAFAKGAAADEMLGVLAERHCPRACIVAGGDVRLGQAPRGLAGWPVKLRVAADLPDHEIKLAAAAVSTSGDLNQSVEIDGVRYSHVIDPSTGLGLTRFTAASVIADTGALSDPLATAACIAGPEQAIASIRRWGGRALRVVTRPGAEYQIEGSPAWPG